jgi:mycofactocin precursor
MSGVLEQDSAAVAAAELEEDAVAAPAEAPADEELVLEDLLVEDVSIDGMCGVY